MPGTERLIREMFFVGLGLYILVYFLTGAVTTAVANTTLKPYAGLIDLIIVVAVLALAWGMFGSVLKGHK